MAFPFNFQSKFNLFSSQKVSVEEVDAYTPAKPTHIFVVGCVRSGTALVRNILNCSEEVCMSTIETHFVGRLFLPGLRHEIKKVGPLSEDQNVHKLIESIYSDQAEASNQGFFRKLIVKSFYSGGRNRYYTWLQKNVDPQYLLQKTLESDRSDQALFDLFMQLYQVKNCTERTTILGEKTPAHIYHVPTLLEWFPQAKVIHILRDPRAVVVSQLNRNRSQVLKQHTRFPLTLLNPLFVFLEVLHMTVAWIWAANLHFKYKRLYPQNYYFLKFEDLIKYPEQSIRQMCDFLGIAFSEKMVQQQIINSSYTPNYVGEAGFNSQAVERWRTQIKPWMRTWIHLAGRKYLEKFGYFLLLYTFLRVLLTDDPDIFLN